MTRFSHIVTLLGSKRFLPTTVQSQTRWFSVSANMSSFYDLKAKKLDGSEFSFAGLKGKVVLIENTASL